MTDQNKSYRTAFIVVTVLFFMWGFITVLVDALIPRLRDVFELSYFEAGLVQFAFFTAYFVFSIPGGYLISRIGYKKGAVTGLVTMGLACLMFYPAAEFRVFPIFLMALFVLAGGITILQVAANPYVAALGPDRTSSSRLNLAQAFNSLGTTIAPLVSAAFILSSSVASSQEVAAMTEAQQQAYYQTEAAAVQGPFIVLAVVLIILAGLFAAFNLPKILEGDENKGGSYRRALKSKHLMFGALGIFVYVGAEVTIGSYLVNYFLSLDIEALVASSAAMTSIASFLSTIFSDVTIANMTPPQLAGTFVFFYWGGAMIGRFIGAGLMQKLNAGNLLAIYGGINIVLISFSMMSGGLTAMWTLLCVGLFNSIMFPTIFTLAIKKLGPDTAQGSGILCTAIVGGAIIPPLYGALADSFGLQIALLLPVCCYLYISWYGKIGSKIALNTV
ncbi:sugar MFS transporter [Gracilimonas mengyeensis]|uniref:MFS transporter, FHS family, L-fucose permease n=1 Tax=Gracilimonas mengyeensis TaxID=1302730 RepID=A0A521EZ63_9BACT|nr:sugar MFS transporter [Gracilimonas mengyeensis]SMO88731.1 MFS transporter, FHS family, L-fucose permease [Gracilimonas mengyeensis]